MVSSVEIEEVADQVCQMSGFSDGHFEHAGEHLVVAPGGRCPSALYVLGLLTADEEDRVTVVCLECRLRAEVSDDNVDIDRAGRLP